eukprot:m.38736 g.38736  ORF g.38736 m.38736 type:complete len:332 (-) comp10028_c1_seq1:95-1090(-)
MEGDMFGGFSPFSYQQIAEVGRSLKERATTLFSPKTPSTSRSREMIVSPIEISPIGTPSRDELNDLRLEIQNSSSGSAGSVDRALIVASALAHRRTEVMVRNGMQQLARLEDTVSNQARTIGRLNDSVADLQIEASAQRAATARLRRGLKENTQQLRDSIARCQAEKRAQDELIARQQSAIESMQRSRSQRDFYVDSAIVVACYITVNLSLVDVPLRLLLRPVPSPRMHRFSRQLLKLILLCYLFIRGRRMATSVGLHNNVGSASNYASLFMRALQLARLRMQPSTDRVPPPVSPVDRTPTRPSHLTRVTEFFSGSPLTSITATPSQWSAD